MCGGSHGVWEREVAQRGQLGTRGGMAYPDAAGGVGVVLVESERACLATTFGNPASIGGVGLRWG